MARSPGEKEFSAQSILGESVFQISRNGGAVATPEQGEKSLVQRWGGCRTVPRRYFWASSDCSAAYSPPVSRATAGSGLLFIVFPVV